MNLGQKLRYLRDVEGHLRGLNRELTQKEAVAAIRQQFQGTISQSYLSQLESGQRKHLTNTTRQILARFFKVHPGYLVDDPEGFHTELVSALRDRENKLDIWLAEGAERFRRDRELAQALLKVARQEDSRKCLLLLAAVLETPELSGKLWDVLQPKEAGL